MQHLSSSSLYSNYIMLDPEGREMCRCGKKRAEWYLNRGLAEMLPGETHRFQLKFKPNGNGAADEFGLAEKKNQCVVCGTVHKLTKHHIVPTMYRQHFPIAFKDRQSHDVLVICTEDHVKYELEADKLKQELEAQFEVSHQPRQPIDFALKNAKNLASALLRHGDKIPAPRKTEIKAQLVEYTGKLLNEQDLLELANRKPITQINDNEIGKQIVNKLLEQGEQPLIDFIKMWRQHFLDISQPKFMPKGWYIHKNPKLNT